MGRDVGRGLHYRPGGGFRCHDGTGAGAAKRLAGMAIDDWLDTISSAGWAAQVAGFADALRGDGQTIAWIADDIDRAWVLRRDEAPLTLTRTAAGEVRDVTVALEGNAVDVLHVVSRRRPLGQEQACRVTDDRAELVHLIDHMDWIAA